MASLLPRLIGGIVTVSVGHCHRALSLSRTLRLRLHTGRPKIRRRRQESHRLRHAGQSGRVHRRVDPGRGRLRGVSGRLLETRLRGLEFVKDHATKEPGKDECAQVVENARELGLLLGKGGLWGQTLRFAPPMNITPADVNFVLSVLDEAIGHSQ